jgi:hypothetical protein
LQVKSLYGDLCSTAAASRRTGGWSPAEDLLLLQAVAQHGKQWTLLQQQQAVPGRTGRQMKDRFMYCLDPALDRTGMSAEVRIGVVV